MNEMLKTSLAQVLVNLASHPETAQAALNASEEALGILYGQAEAAGSEEAKALVMQAWETTQGLVQQNVDLISVATESTRLAMETAAQLEIAQEELDATREEMSELESDNERIQTEYDELQNDVQWGNRDNELVAGLVEDVQEQAYQDAQEVAMDYAYDDTYEQLHENLEEMTGCHWQLVKRCIDVLKGARGTTADQRHLLRVFVESLKVEPEPEVDHARH